MGFKRRGGGVAVVAWRCTGRLSPPSRSLRNSCVWQVSSFYALRYLYRQLVLYDTTNKRAGKGPHGLAAAAVATAAATDAAARVSIGRSQLGRLPLIQELSAP